MTDGLDGDDGYLSDRKVAELLGKHIKTIKRWDKSAKLKALGWPPPVDFNGRLHRHRPALKTFLHNAALAHVSDSKTAT
jgi:hypothetical protein